jgi:hypothetical protein
MLPYEEEAQDRTLFDILRAILGQRHARELTQELWGLSLTIAPIRFSGDPFEIDPKTVPDGMAYQWMPESSVAQAQGTWKQVPASRHDGLYAPIGSSGPIVFRGMALVERPRDDVEGEHAERIKKAHANVEKWYDKFGGMFSGHVKIGTSEETAETRKVGDTVLGAKISAATKIPPEMWDHATAILEECDRLRQEANVAGKTIDEAALTATAIENIRALLKKESAA